MSVAENKAVRPKRLRMPDSIFVKCLLVLAVSSALTVGIVTFKSMRASEMIAMGSVMKLGAEVATQLGERSAAALRFRKADDISAILRTSIDALDGSASGALVMSLDGDVVAQEMLDGHGTEYLEQVARSALEAREQRENSEHLVIAVPIRHGADREIIGVLALDWRTDVLYAVVRKQNELSLMLAAGIGFIMLCMVGWLIRRLVARPLLQVSAAMREVSEGNYEVAIPQYRRGNEIGVVARTLEDFRDKLKAADETRREAAMRSAALQAGSAAMMIADADFNVVYCSPAVTKLLTTHKKQIVERVPGFDPDTVVGQSIDIFHKRAEMQREMLQALGDQSHVASLEMGDVTLSLNVSKIDNEDGDRIGYVVEWADVTEQKLNAAVLASLNSNQARAEFDGNGLLVDANDAFCALARVSLRNEAFRFAETVFADDRSVDPEKADFREYEIRSLDGQSSYILGGLSPIFRNSGGLKRTVLIGADVTEQRRQKLLADQERSRMQMEQESMIGELSNALAVLAEGDLKIRIETAFAGANDRIRQDFNQALGRLEEAITSVVASATTIRAEVSGVAAASEELSKRTESQAATLEQTAAAISEISASVSSSAEGAKSANDVVGLAKKKARDSEGVVRDAVSAMGKIEKSSSEITSIVKVIDEIAFQTNLLALNAGVEAARAGDAGRGFAVVASEVRALAQRSSEAANEISSLISTSSENVDLGVKLVGNAGEALANIIASISEISDYVAQIASASQEQSLTISEINSAMTQLDHVTQQNAAMFEETSAASQNLTVVAAELSKQVDRFSVSGEGGSRDENFVLEADVKSPEQSSASRFVA